jgi:hypothetical protein
VELRTSPAGTVVRVSTDLDAPVRRPLVGGA